jgi:hypothetical protein
VGLEERHTMAVAFAAFEAEHARGIRAHDVDPQRYVREQG